MNSKILGNGGFGCVIIPNLTISNSTSKCISEGQVVLDSNCRQVSKIFKVVKNRKKHTRKKFEAEFWIGQQLKENDPDNIFFIGGDKCGEWKKSSLKNKKVVKQIEDYFEQQVQKKNVELNRECFFNIEMKFAYPFRPVLEWFYTVDSLILVFAHLILAVKQIVENTNFLFMDIKETNMLFHVFNNKFIHPVLIDFSSDHIMGGNYTLHKYVRGFNTKLSQTWPPEIKMLMKLYNNEKITFCKLLKDFKTQEIENSNRNRYIHKKPPTFISERLNSSIMNSVKNQKKMVQKSLLLLLSEWTKSTISANIREKIMIWEIANVFLFLFPYYSLKQLKVQKFFKVLKKSLHVDLTQRLNCEQLLTKLNTLLHIDDENNNVSRYMIKLPHNLTQSKLDEHILKNI